MVGMKSAKQVYIVEKFKLGVLKSCNGLETLHSVTGVSQVLSSDKKMIFKDGLSV